MTISSWTERRSCTSILHEVPPAVIYNYKLLTFRWTKWRFSFYFAQFLQIRSGLGGSLDPSLVKIQVQCMQINFLKGGGKGTHYNIVWKLLKIKHSHKTVRQQDDCRTQGMILNSPINMKYSNCAVFTDPSLL